MGRPGASLRGASASLPRTTPGVVPTGDPPRIGEPYGVAVEVPERLRSWGDPVLAVVLGAGMVAEVAGSPRADLPAAAVLAAGSGLVLAGRRRLPLLDALLVVVGLQAVIALAPGFQTASVFLPAVFLLSLYSLGRHARGVEAWLAVPLVVATVVLLVLDDGGPAATETVFYSMFDGLPWAAGLAVRLRVDRVTDLRARAAAIEEETRRAVADERVRIARELHDVVSHAIAVTVLQARGSRRLVGRDDDAVRRALVAVEGTHTAALGDMRRLLDLLRRTGEEDGGPEPPPTMSRVGELIEQVRAAGVRVEQVVVGDPLPMTPGVELCAYRIVQEALTNVVKHGGAGARAVVTLRYRPDRLLVEVDSTVRGTPTPLSGGHGLIGVRERVAVLGGTVEAGPSADGWRVHAAVPYLETAQVR